MLEDLEIKDFALITSSTLNLGGGFTVLSGETGAGKSILIGALSFLLGGKADVKMIRSGAHEASVCGTFFIGEKKRSGGDGEKGEADRVENYCKEGRKEYKDAIEGEEEELLFAIDWLEEHGIESENGRVLVRRTLKENGKSAAWIGGVAVTRSDLSSFSALLVDIHGQHEHQVLMKVGEHRRFLDARAGIENEVKKFTSLYAALVEKRRAIDEVKAGGEEREKEKEMLSFAVQEIEDAKLFSGEDEELKEEENRLSSYEKLCSEIENVVSSAAAAVSALKSCMKEASYAAQMDKSLASLSARTEAAFYEADDIAEEFSAYKERLVFDPSRLSVVQDRLSVIYNLLKKYTSPTSPIDDVIKYAANAQKRLDDLEKEYQDVSELEGEVKEIEGKVYTLAKSISVKRKAAGEKMAKEVEKVLQNLGMAGTRFFVSVTDKGATKGEQKCSPYGMDNVEFLISANVSSPLMPLAQIASGGELSRVMLALKSVIAESDPVPTLVFDEIDTGIGGEVAVEVGSYLRELASFKQILCITHLASIAVYADNQVKIEKEVHEGRAISACRTVTGEEREREIARMLSGEESSEAVDHARAMLLRFSRRNATQQE